MRRQTKELFELYQRCANRKQADTIYANFLQSITFLGKRSRKNTPLMVNSFHIIDDEKRRGKMTEEFYAPVKKEIAERQERAIQSRCRGSAVLERRVLKIQGLEERKRHYEQILRRELDELDDEFGTLKILG